MNELIKRMKNSKVLTVLLSILIACIIWIFVVNAEDPDINDTIRNVPITVIGQAELDARGLMITDQSQDDMDLHLTGKRRSLFNLNDKNIPVLVDVSSISTAGTYDLLCTVSLPSGITGGTVTINNRETYRVTMTVEERVKKTVEIVGNLSGSVARGYRAGEFIISPSSIEISGPASLLATIECARVDLAGNGLKETFSGLLPIELVTVSGGIIDIDQVECAASSVYTVCPIVMVKQLDLTVDVIAGGGATAENVSCHIFPETITVSGKESQLANLEELVLGEIDLAQISGNGVVLLPIELPAGVTSEDGSTEAQVTVEFRDLSTKSLEMTSIELKNIPEGYAAEVVSGSVQVIVRGSADEVAAVRADQLHLEADLSHLPPQSGEVEVPVKVILPTTDMIGLVGTYSVRVNLQQQ